jgi:hypothetical protein
MDLQHQSHFARLERALFKSHVSKNVEDFNIASGHSAEEGALTLIKMTMALFNHHPNFTNEALPTQPADNPAPFTLSGAFLERVADIEKYAADKSRPMTAEQTTAIRLAKEALCIK